MVRELYMSIDISTSRELTSINDIVRVWPSIDCTWRRIALLSGWKVVAIELVQCMHYVVSDIQVRLTARLELT